VDEAPSTPSAGSFSTRLMIRDLLDSSVATPDVGDVATSAVRALDARRLAAK
jgi:hypothetical protein